MKDVGRMSQGWGRCMWRTMQVLDLLAVKAEGDRNMMLGLGSIVAAAAAAAAAAGIGLMERSW